jgi:hypothetical protein
MAHTDSGPGRDHRGAGGDGTFASLAHIDRVGLRYLSRPSQGHEERENGRCLHVGSGVVQEKKPQAERSRQAEEGDSMQVLGAGRDKGLSQASITGSWSA